MGIISTSLLLAAGIAIATDIRFVAASMLAFGIFTGLATLNEMIDNAADKIAKELRKR